MKEWRAGSATTATSIADVGVISRECFVSQDKEADVQSGPALGTGAEGEGRGGVHDDQIFQLCSTFT